MCPLFSGPAERQDGEGNHSASTRPVSPTTTKQRPEAPAYFLPADNQYHHLPRATSDSPVSTAKFTDRSSSGRGSIFDLPQFRPESTFFFPSPSGTGSVLSARTLKSRLSAAGETVWGGGTLSRTINNPLARTTRHGASPD